MTHVRTAPGINDPRARFEGREAQVGYPVGIERAAQTDSLARSPLTDILPEFRTVQAGFTAISVANPSIAAGQSAWHCIADFSPRQIAGDDVALFKLSIAMLPADTDGNGDTAGSLSWGTTHGLGAAIVIGTGRSIPVDPDSGWTSAPAPVPGVETTGDGPLQYGRIAGGGGDILWIPFPPGSLSDSIPLPGGAAPNFSPYVKRFRREDRIRAALVVRRSFIDGQTNTLRGYCSLQFHLGLVTPDTPYR